MAHPRVDHLRPPGSGPVTQAIAVGTEVRAALDYFARNPELRLPPVVAVFGGAAARITRNTAGCVHLVRVAVGVPISSPVPDVARHVIQTVRVGRERSDCRRGAIAAVG